jgi:hypothetical protein
MARVANEPWGVTIDVACGSGPPVDGDLDVVEQAAAHKVNAATATARPGLLTLY